MRMKNCLELDVAAITLIAGPFDDRLWRRIKTAASLTQQSVHELRADSRRSAPIKRDSWRQARNTTGQARGAIRRAWSTPGIA